MAMYDWNRNGKNDPVDDYLEYQISEESMEFITHHGKAYL